MGKFEQICIVVSVCVVVSVTGGFVLWFESILDLFDL
jgi:hypothetical protein